MVFLGFRLVFQGHRIMLTKVPNRALSALSGVVQNPLRLPNTRNTIWLRGGTLLNGPSPTRCL